MKKLIVALLLVGLPSFVWAQKIGVIAFEDAANAGPELGEQVAKFIRSELLKNKKYIPKFIQYKAEEGESTSIDFEKAVELGKKNGVDYVVIGTILEAEVTKGSAGVGNVTIMGQPVGSSLRSVTATLTIQGDLISVATGELVESYRATGSKSDRSVGADVSTEWGSLNVGGEGSGNTPNAQALREAVEDLVKQLSKAIK
jgi:curli biogenesis system outer membrane secretion channel CsgG